MFLYQSVGSIPSLRTDTVISHATTCCSQHHYYYVTGITGRTRGLVKASSCSVSVMALVSPDESENSFMSIHLILSL